MTNKTVATSRWLADNAVIAAQKGLPDRTWGDRCWILADHLVEKLIFQLTEKEDHFLNGSARGHMYFTTHDGLVIIDPKGIHNRDVVTFDGFRYLRPEIPRDRWYSAESMYNRWMAEVTTDMLAGMELARVEKVAKEQAAAQERQNRIARVEQEQRAILPDNQDYQGLITQAMQFDHTFEYSDDHRYAMNTRARKRKLCEAIDAFDLDGRAIVDRIIFAHGGTN